VKRFSLERILLLILVACVFAMSARAINAVAQAGGHGQLSVLLPVAVDGFAVLAAMALFRLRPGRERIYPWTLLVALVGLSSYLNYLHAHVVPVPGVELTQTEAEAIAIAIPILLAASLHLVLIIRRADERRSEALEEASPTTGTPQAANGPESPSAAAQGAVPAPVQPVAEPSEGSRADARLWYQSTTPTPTPFELSQAAGVPVTTASRWIEEWKVEDDDVEEPARRAGRVQFH